MNTRTTKGAFLKSWIVNLRGKSRQVLCRCLILTGTITPLFFSTIAYLSNHCENRDMVVESWKRQHHGQTIYPTEKFTSMNLFKKFWVVTWAWPFLTSEVMEAVRGQKHPLEAKNGMKELINWKKGLNKSFSINSKTS